MKQEIYWVLRNHRETALRYTVRAIWRELLRSTMADTQEYGKSLTLVSIVVAHLTNCKE